MSRVDMPMRRTALSIAKLIVISVSSAVFTVLTIFLLVLPASYSLDPTGIAAKIGITKAITGTGHHYDIATGRIALPQRQAVAPVPKTISADAIDYSGGLVEQRNEHFELVVLPKQSLIFKFAMVRDYELDFHWVTDGKPLVTELQGLKKAADAKQLKVFGKINESKGKGFFIAPFDGVFSLNWKNATDQAAKVRLNLKGNYEILS